jgi:non-ribosomal peptide synthetase component F
VRWTSISGRQQEEVESLIGFFVNTLPLRTSINVDASFTDLLQDVVTTTLGAQEHQQVPFEKVVEAVVKERDLSRNPLFDVLFILQNTPDIPALHFGDVDLCVESQEHVTAQFDITLRMKEHPDGLMIKAEYNTGLFSQHTLQRLLTHFKQIVKTVISNPSITVGEIQMLSEAEKHQLLIDFNDTATNYPKDKTIIDLFVEQVQIRPDAVAAVFEGKQLTFQKLNEKSNQLAHYLRGRGVKAETLVPVCIDRSLEMIIGILAILKAGGAYVPIDPAYPHDRINHILEDTSATLVIAGKESKSQLPAKAGLEIIEIGEGVSLFQSQPSTNLTVNIQPFDVAYVIFTSGSTGKPKGAMNEHRGIYNRLLWAKEYFSFSGEDIILQKTPYTFDVSVWELLGSTYFGVHFSFCQARGTQG